MPVTFKLGDTRTIRAQLFDERGPFNLAGTTVTIRILHADGIGRVLERPATIVTANTGTVAVTLTPDDITSEGKYSVEWVVSGVDGEETFPSQGSESFEVFRRL